MTTGYDIDIITDDQYGFHFDHVTRELAMKRFGLIGKEWEVGVCMFECPDREDDCHDDHQWVFLTVDMYDGKDVHHITLHRQDIETLIDRRRLNAWENQEPAWPHAKGQS